MSPAFAPPAGGRTPVVGGEESGRAPRWWRPFLIALFAAALLWRAGVLLRLAGGPLLTALGADSEVYWGWAGEIRSGRWAGGNPFFLGPLYPYWLAILRTVLGDQVLPILWLQSALGALAPVLLADACRRLAGARVAAPIGVLLAGYGMAVFFDLLILMEGLLYLLESLALWLVVRNGRRSPLPVGTLIGAMALGRPMFALLLVPYAIHLAVSRPGRIVRSLAAALAVPVAIAAGTAFYHSRTAGGWIPLTYSGGYNLYVGNGPYATGTYVPISDLHGNDDSATEGFGGGSAWDGRAYLERTEGTRLTAAGSMRRWVDLTATHVRAHAPGAARLYVRKVALLVNHRELPQVLDARVLDRAGGPLGWPLDLEFACFGVLGLLGVPMAWRHGREARFVAACLVLLLVGTAVFFVVDRYRIHLLPPLAMLAALAVRRGADALSAREWRPLVTGGVLGIGTLAVIFAPLVPSHASNEEWVYATALGDAWLLRGDAVHAIPFLERAADLDRAGALRGAETPVGRASRAGAFEDLATAYSMVGERGRAIASLEAAVSLAPEARPARVRYANQLALDGRWNRAADEYRKAGWSRTRAAEELVGLAVRRFGRGENRQGRECLEAAVGMDPAYERAVIPLLRLEIAEGALPLARARLLEAEAHGLDAGVARAHLAWIRAAEGDTAGARRLLLGIPNGARERDPRIAATLKLMAESRTTSPPSPEE